jgi:hypothetical protein
VRSALYGPAKGVLRCSGDTRGAESAHGAPAHSGTHRRGPTLAPIPLRPWASRVLTACMRWRCWVFRGRRGRRACPGGVAAGCTSEISESRRALRRRLWAGWRAWDIGCAPHRRQWPTAASATGSEGRMDTRVLVTPGPSYHRGLHRVQGANRGRSTARACPRVGSTRPRRG